MSRGFEVAKSYEEREVNLPIQKTTTAAGYDFESAETVMIPSIWRQLFGNLTNGSQDKSLKPTLVKTGIKAYMADDEALFLYNRSSNPLKKFLLLANGVGVIDSDYYGNEDNDGDIAFQFINFGFTDRKISKGEAIGQGVFGKFLKADASKARHANEVRVGGHGSTD